MAPRVYLQLNALHRSDFVHALRSSGFDVTASATGLGCDDVLGRVRPDAALVELDAEFNPDARSVCAQLREHLGAVTAFFVESGDLAAVMRGFDAGADDCVAYDVSAMELVARVRALCRRARSAELSLKSALTCGAVRLELSSRNVTYRGHRIELTHTEFELLTALMMSADAVVSKPRLLQQVWRYTTADTNVVEVHVSALRRKLERRGPRVIHTVRSSGYVMRTASHSDRPLDTRDLEPWRASWQSPGEQPPRHQSCITSLGCESAATATSHGQGFRVTPETTTGLPGAIACTGQRADAIRLPEANLELVAGDLRRLKQSPGVSSPRWQNLHTN